MSVKVTKVPPKPLPSTYVLEMDEYTALALYALAGAVGGVGPNRDAMSDIFYELNRVLSEETKGRRPLIGSTSINTPIHFAGELAK